MPRPYAASGAIRHADWNERRIRRLQDTLVEGDRGFLAGLDPVKAAQELVDDRFVRKAVAANGGLAAFGFPDAMSRTEIVAP